MGERGLVDDGAQRTLLPQGGDPPDDVARGPLGEPGVGHARPLRPDGGGESLEVELTRDRDDGDDETAVGREVGLGQEGLEDPGRVDAERLGGLGAEGGRGRVVLVRPDDEGGPARLEQPDGGRAAGRRLLPAQKEPPPPMPFGASWSVPFSPRPAASAV
ncbi:hypothetical protein GCM10022199_02870 [Marihabitans asiaticum]